VVYHIPYTVEYWSAIPVSAALEITTLGMNDSYVVIQLLKVLLNIRLTIGNLMQAA